jgi:ubiquinone/menaquinone biosynthesis C-methylase UbiE
MSLQVDDDMQITASKWKEAYQKLGAVSYDRRNPHPSIIVTRFYIQKYIDPSARLFLEAGCGTARSSLDISLNLGIAVVCLDITQGALLIAKRIFKENNASGFFVRGDMRYLPFKEGSIDFIFSDGALEHFRETGMAVSEFFRILDKSGRVLLTVPQISLSMMTFGQLQGNIPNIPVVRQIVMFVQTELLKSKFMKNGYELSFTLPQLKRMLSIFSCVDVGLYETFHELRWLRSSTLRKFVWALMRHRLFCPLIYGFGVKSRE